MCEIFAQVYNLVRLDKNNNNIHVFSAEIDLSINQLIS